MSKRLFIFEGPDGAGKTTAATKFAELIGARYDHYGPLPGREVIADVYAEGMLPAILGHTDIVMDRCWISEGPYGRVFRKGENRISTSEFWRLTDLALMCAKPIVIRCLPPWEVVRESFDSRPEMLKNVDQLRFVYDWYRDNLDSYQKGKLSVIHYDYTQDNLIRKLV